MITLLSVVVPAYNEEKNIEIVLHRLRDAKSAYNIPKEIIVIDDCSTDNTKRQIEKFKDAHPDASIMLISHDVNKGKGAALRTGIQKASGDLVIIQDADLEYDPEEFDLLLKPFIKNVADVVYGSRFIGGGRACKACRRGGASQSLLATPLTKSVNDALAAAIC